MQQPTPRSGVQPGQTRTVIYGALILGVVMFAAIVRFVVEPVGTFAETPLRFVWLAAAAACTLAAGYFSTRLAGPGADDAQLTMAAVVVWALAEGQALLGIVAYMLGGDVIVFWCSLAVFAYLFARYRPAVFRPTGTRSPQ